MGIVTERRGLLLWMFSGSLAALAGCVHFLPAFPEPTKRDLVEPECPLLRGQKVAIVCGNEKGLSVDALSTLLARYVENKLTNHAKDIEVIPPELVNYWLQANGDKALDYAAIGAGVGADYLLVITLANLSLRDGKSSFKGRCDISVAVCDIENGTIAFRKSMPEFEFPKINGPSIKDTTEAKFRVSFLTIVSTHIGVLFYPYDPNDLAVQDPISKRL